MDKIPYVKVGAGPTKMVYLRGGTDLLLSVIADPISNGRSKQKLITADHTMYIIGYQQNLPLNATIETVAEDIARAIEKYIGASTIIGNSLGGIVAIHLAAKHPELVKKLILATSAYRFSPSFVKRLRTWIKLGEEGEMLKLSVKMNDFFNNFFLRNAMKLMTILLWPKTKRKLNPISTAVNVLRDLLEHDGDVKQLLPLIQAETAILGGTKDIVFSQEDYQETATLIPRAKLILLPGFGHVMADEHPKLYRNEFLKFI